VKELALGALLIFGALAYINEHPGVKSQVFTPAPAEAALAQPSPVQPTPTTLPEPKPFVHNEVGKVVKVRGVTMPGNCLQLVPELVTYVEQHPEIADKDIPDYVCGWY
jgi:hypothetical protein